MDQINELTNREREVVKLLLEGKSNKQIAFSLHITDNTVEFHLKNIYAKYQVSSRTELILKLRDSVVAGKGEDAENGDRLQVLNWYASLKDTLFRIGKEFKMESSSFSNTSNESTTKTFYEAIFVCFKKYAEFNGRASRSEFWWFVVFILLVASALAYVNQAYVSIFLIATLLPLLAAGTRRLRDSGQNPWWQLFLLAPVGGIVLLGILWSKPTITSQPDTTPAA